ncbi:MAG: prolyl oligopeptidase family serine peptidase [Phycisphaeraceae bacterium]|nr:prolyl oligopeptidase family serine peptidase [Phycisphaeraceae bacterium]
MKTTPPERFKQFPRDLASAARVDRLGPDVPAVLAHPDWKSPAPLVLWMHGRTANKELDPGRFLRWIRAGIAACSIDLPGHGERPAAGAHEPDSSLRVIAQAVSEIDGVVESLADARFGGVFDLDRIAIGGMSMGGIVTLRRLCDPNSFVCAAVEGTTGWLEGLYFPEDRGAPAETNPRWVARHDRDAVARVSAAAHLDGFRPLPLLMLHSQADKMMPFVVAKGFIERLRAHYAKAGADPSIIEVNSWPSTGAPEEHIGFGRFSNDAKNLQTAFFAKHLRAVAPIATDSD